MAKLTGQGMADYAISKIGTPYFYGSKMTVLTEAFMKQMHRQYPKTVTNLYMAKARLKKMVGKVCVDCSGLVGGYRGKQIGSSQLYSSASKRIRISDINKMPIGTVLWKQGHVGILISFENGVPMCVEARGINYGVVKTKVSATKWTYGLLFSDIEYTEMSSKINIENKPANPYSIPTVTLRKGCKGNAVKWLQFELLEAGITTVKVGGKTKTLTIDGSFGGITEAAVIKYQQSAKLEADGICGRITRTSLKDN